MASESSRPLLLPQNRRLRHLQGIYLRNLTLARPRGETIDDATLNKTSQKLQALREEDIRGPELHLSTSSDNINSVIRPRVTRRRSSVWAGATPGYRQKKLEDVIYNGMVDTFFSLHCEGEEEPIYISEVVEKAMNPNFAFFSLSTYGPSITRQCQVTIKFWTKRTKYFALLEQPVDLRTLHFIGSLTNRALPPNCIVFHLVDGIYTLDLPEAEILPPKPHLPEASSSYSALMRLSSLDEAVQDALATREQIAASINEILDKQPPDEAPEAQESAALAAKYVNLSTTCLKAATKQRSEMKAYIDAKREGIKTGLASQALARKRLEEVAAEIPQLEEEKKKLGDEIRGQRRRLCEELMIIFPMEPTPKSLVFTICGLVLPNSTYEAPDVDEDGIAAALGHTALLVSHLAVYLGIHLPYPTQPFGSRSVIIDEISQLADSNRIFPLFSKGSIPFRFEYAVFLLNKDIETLCERQALKVQDIRMTLPNLKYALYVGAAGEGELPQRIKGGIRQLLGSRRGTPSVSRRTSDDGSQGDKKGCEQPVGTESGHKRANLSLQFTFGEERNLSLRTNGMREGRS